MALKVVAHTRAWLARMQTTDGKFRVHDDVYLGKEYRILPATIHMHPWTDDATGEVVERLSVMMEALVSRSYLREGGDPVYQGTIAIQRKKRLRTVWEHVGYLALSGFRGQESRSVSRGEGGEDVS